MFEAVAQARVALGHAALEGQRVGAGGQAAPAPERAGGPAGVVQQVAGQGASPEPLRDAQKERTADRYRPFFFGLCTRISRASMARPCSTLPPSNPKRWAPK